MAGVQFVDTPAGRIEYRWAGSALRDAALPVLVFLHEGLGCVTLWKDFPDQVAQATGLPALVYSRIGYGGSSACALPRPITYMHDEGEAGLPDLLAALGIQSHILIGHSDGASISLIYAGAKERDGLQGVAVMAPHVFCEDVSVRSIRAADKAYAEGDLKARLAKYHGDNVDCAFRGWCDSWLNPEFHHWNIEAYVDRIKVPVVVIQGEDDEYGTAAQVESIRQRTAAETLLIPGCGHSPQRDQPAATLKALTGFIHSLGF
ncbi:alpha/beta hydrolase [Ferrovibrio sp.]|uniref:alpha/beta fold hydrolase n=1 Tax=Ferrovibrio sp. TaxID=1917215 RepID=UPI000CAF9D23|nr:alpha/beta hydrolase [Ferrovibrio sp.]PJI43240.1 MAG: alpha/beta hydrolase [Ferrovibrio sp.]